MPPSEQWLTTGQAAAALSVTTTTIRRWIESGIIRDVRKLPGGRFQIPHSEVDRIIRESQYQ